MQDKYKIVKISKKNKYLQINWNDNHISRFHFLWLRDNCPTAFHKDTRMRNFNILSVSKNIKPINIKHSKKTLNIIWSENNHVSEYNLHWLRNNCYTEKNLKPYKSPYKLWNTKFITKIKKLTFDYKRIISNDIELKKC